MIPSDSHGRRLLTDLAKRAKKARRDSTTPDNQKAIKDYKERNAGFHGCMAVVLVIIVIAALVQFVM